MPSSDSRYQAVERFVARLWQHARLRAMKADPDSLAGSAKQLKLFYDKLTPKEQEDEVGESLAAHILNFAVHQYSRKNCIICTKFIGCEDAENGPCANFVQDKAAYHSGRALLAEAVYLLDGAYGINAQEMLSIICRFLDEMAGDTKQDGIT